MGGQDIEALPFLGEALAVEARKDSVSVFEAMELIDLMIKTQQKGTGQLLESMESNHRALKLLRGNLKGRGLNEGKEYGVLCHKMSLLYMHESKQDSKGLQRALRLAKSSVRLLQKYDGDKDAADWLRMGKLHLQMLSSIPKQHSL